MRLAVLSCGALVVSHKDTSWLFGAPEGIAEALKEAGIDTPGYCFTTNLRAPGYGTLGPIVRFKEQKLVMGGLTAEPISHRHGTDYAIKAEDGSMVLFSERGDVSAQDVEGYQLALIKNKHRSDRFADSVITWPWADAEWEVVEKEAHPLYAYKVWNSMDDVPDNLKHVDGVALTLDQSNFLARVAEASGTGGKENWAIAMSQFKKSFEKKDGSWVKRKPKTQEKEELENSEGRTDGGPLGLKEYTGDELIQAIEQAGGSRLDILTISEKSDGSYYIDLGDWAADRTVEALKEVFGPVDYDLEAPPSDDWELVWPVVKEVDEFGQPHSRFGDVITAAMHTAYNDVSDKYFKKGYLSQDERMAVASAVGPALKALRENLPAQLMDREVVCDEEEGHMMSHKAANISWTYKSQEGTWRWASISSVADWDRQEELFTTKAMDWALNFNRLLEKMGRISNKGPLRYRHIPGLDGGDCDTQSRVGDYLFESGTFRDTPLGLTMRTKMESEPGWGVSLGLLYADTDIVDGQYQRAAIFERSMTPDPAVVLTSINTVNKEGDMKLLNEEQLKQAAEELGMELTEVKTMYERAIAAGGPLGLKEFSTQLKASQFEKEANMSTKDLTEALAELSEEEFKEVEETLANIRSTRKSETEMLAEALAELDETEFKEVESILAQVKAGKKKMPPEMIKKMEEMEASAGDDEEEDAAEEKTKTKDVDPVMALLLAQVKSNNEAMTAQTKTMQGMLMALLAGGGKMDQAAVKEAVGSMLGELPRDNVDSFVSKNSQPANGEGDAAILKKLKELEQRVPGNNGLYGFFTSQKLNANKDGGR